MLAARSIVPGGEALLIDEQSFARRRLVDAACRLLSLLHRLLMAAVLIRRAAEVRAAEDRLAERIQLLSLVDATIRRHVELLLGMLLVVSHGQLDVARRAADNNVVDILRRICLLQAAMLDTVVEVHNETWIHI